MLACCQYGFSQNLKFTESTAVHIPAHGNLAVRWEAPTNYLQAGLWVYQLLPRKLISGQLSNLVAACSLEKSNVDDRGDLKIFNSLDGISHLRVSDALGIVDYISQIKRSPTNLVEGVPNEDEALKLTKSYLPKWGINLSDIEQNDNHSGPEFHIFETGVTYFISGNAVTNIEARVVRFNRSIDGDVFVSVGTGGDGEIDYGPNGQITRLLMSWRNIERQKSYKSFTPKQIIEAIRKGKAVQGMIPENVDGIDWAAVNSVEIKKIKICYYAGGDRFSPSDLLKPYAALWTTIDNGTGQFDVEIDCPVIDDINP